MWVELGSSHMGLNDLGLAKWQDVILPSCGQHSLYSGQDRWCRPERPPPLSLQTKECPYSHIRGTTWVRLTGGEQVEERSKETSY